MSASNQTDQVIAGHKNNGGHNGRLAGHALRLLHEAIELCVATGSDRAEIEGRVQMELAKAERKGEFDLPVEFDTVREELADVSFLVDIIAHQTGDASLAMERAAKLAVLNARAWKADQDGVLWRPGASPLKSHESASSNTNPTATKGD